MNDAFRVGLAAFWGINASLKMCSSEVGLGKQKGQLIMQVLESTQRLLRARPQTWDDTHCQKQPQWHHGTGLSHGC
jgi:hypothetical protein